MAKIIKYTAFKRGDTPQFGFVYTPPFVGFVWTSILVDAAITSVDAPNDNTGASVVRLNQTLTINADNTASFSFGPTIAESKLLTPGSTYKVEVQLKESGVNVATPITGQVDVVQDYVI